MLDIVLGLILFTLVQAHLGSENCFISIPDVNDIATESNHG